MNHSVLLAPLASIALATLSIAADAQSLGGANTWTGVNTFERGVLGAPSTSNWLPTYSYGSGVIAGLDSVALNSVGISGAARSSDYSSGSPAMIGVVGWGFGDNTTTDPSIGTWGGYFEDRSFPNSTGYGAGVEIDITNLRGLYATVNPYSPFTPGSTVGLHIGSGGGCTGTAECYNPATKTHNLAGSTASAALQIDPNSASFGAGIVFGSGSIVPVNSNYNAIELPQGYEITWWTSASTLAASVYSDASGNLNFNSGNIVVTGVAAVSCSGPPTASFTVTHGVVTHC